MTQICQRQNGDCGPRQWLKSRWRRDLDALARVLSSERLDLRVSHHSPTPMRLLSLAALAAALLAAPASAQAQIGLKAGLNVANFVGDNADGSEARLGFVGGLTSRFDITPSVAFQLEALYSQKGEVINGDAIVDDRGNPLYPSRDFDIDTRLDYLEIPASLRFGVPLSPLLDAGVSVGGYVGIPLSSEVSADGDAPRVILDDIDADDVETNTDYGVLVGVDVGSGPFFVDAHYTLGLAEVADFDPVFGSGGGEGLDRKNSVVSLTLGYRFGGGNARRY